MEKLRNFTLHTYFIDIVTSYLQNVTFSILLFLGVLFMDFF